MITNNENSYIRNIIKAICKTNAFTAAIYLSKLYIIVEKTQLYIINLDGKLNNDLIIGFDNTSLVENPEYILDSNCLDYVLKSASIYISYITDPNNIIYTYPDLKADPNFNEIMSYKSADGGKIYYIDEMNRDVPIMTFGGLFNLNKADRISADIYRTHINGVSLVNFHIYKKRINLNYDMIMRVLNM